MELSFVDKLSDYDQIEKLCCDKVVFMSDIPNNRPSTVEQECRSEKSDGTIKTIVQPQSNSQRNQVCNEMPLLVYSYLKSSGFDAMADNFLGEIISNNVKIQIWQPIDLTLEECKTMANSIDPSRLTKVVSWMKEFVERVNQTENVDDNASSSKQQISLSLIAPAQQKLSEFMSVHNIKGGLAQSVINKSSRREMNIAQLIAAQKFTGPCDLKKLYSACNPFKNLRLMKRILGHVSAIYCFTLDRTKCTLFTGGEDGLVKIWNLDKCFLAATLRGHVKAVNDLSINHRNDRLASCGVDGTIRVWNLEDCALLYTLRNGHNSSVMSVCFSPYPVGRYRYLISTGLNGTLCYYKIDQDNNINPNPIKFAEKQPNKHFRINCFTVSPGGTYVVLGVTDPTIRVYKMGIKGPVRTMELYGHSDEVESVEFDNNGSRFCSSSKDGTICIWTLSVTSWKCVQIDVKKDMLTNLKNKETGSTKKKKNYTINLISWSCDNKRICCACADFVIRTYDSCSREIVSRFEVHTDRVSVLHHHPTAGNLLLSSGCDGNIYLWDTDTGSIKVSLENNLGEQGFGSVYDLSFLSNGRDIVMCDYHGNWAIYSPIPNQTLKDVPDSQFFHSDYWEIREDITTGKVVDVLSGVEPHLMTPPLMVNYFGIPYSNAVQKLIPGAALLNSETEFNYNHINLLNDTTVSGPGLATSGSVEGVRKTGIMNKKNRSNLNCSWLMWFRRLIVHKLAKMDINEDFQTRLQLYKHEQSIYNNVRHKASEFYDKEERVGRLLHLQSLQKERQLEKQSRRVVALPIISNTDDDRQQPVATSLAGNNSTDEWDTTNNMINAVETYPGDVIDNNTDYDETFQYYRGAQDERYSDIDFMEESDEYMLDENRPTRSVNRQARLRSLRPRNSTGSTITHMRNMRNGRTRALTRNGGVDATTESTLLQDNANVVADVEEVPPPVPDDYPSLWVSSDIPTISPYVPQYGDQVYYFIQGHRLYLQDLFRQNLTNLLPSVAVYEEYDRFIVPELNPKGYELCQVVDIQYIYKNPLICKIKLKRLEKEKYTDAIALKSNDKSYYDKDCFVLEFHDMTNILDFIVLREVVDTAMKREWSSGDRFKSIIDNCWWYGCVESRSEVDSEFPQSPHLSYVIRWDTGEYDRISPWDMECIDSEQSTIENMTLVDGDMVVDPFSLKSRIVKDDSPESVSSSNESTPSLTNDKMSNVIQQEAVVVDPVAISCEEMRKLCERYIQNNLHRNESELWGWEEPFVACERIADAIENFRNHYIAYAFSMPVDLITFSDYWTIVPHPLDLSKVISRLRNHYYRSKDAIIFDIKVIKLNALSYNKANAPISQCANILFTLLEELIKNKDQLEVNLKHSLLVGKRYPTNVCGPLTVKSSKRVRRRKFVKFEYSSDESDEEHQLSRNTKLGSSEMMVEWINDAFDLLNYLMNLKDSECFLNPVNLDDYPEYTQFVRCPMDFNTVLDKLKSGTYIHPIEMIDDVKLIFSNSQTFNTNPRSKIYSMTARLSNQFMARSKSFLKDWMDIAPLKRPLTRSIIRNIYNNYLATQNPPFNMDGIDTSVQPSSSRNAVRPINMSHSPEPDNNRSPHKYSLRKSKSYLTKTQSTNTIPHRYGNKRSTSSFSPQKISPTTNKYDVDEECKKSDDSSSNDEVSNESDENSYQNQYKSIRIHNDKSTYKTYKDIDVVSASIYSTPPNSKNKTYSRTSLNRSFGTDSSIQQQDNLNIPDTYFGNVSPIANNPTSAIRRSHRIRKRNSYCIDTYPVVEESNEDQNQLNSKYNLRRPNKRRYS